MSTKLFEQAAAAIDLATKGKAATDTAAMNVGDLCVILGLLRSLSSQSLSLSEAMDRLAKAYEAKHRCNEDANYERRARLDAEAEIERLKGLVAGIRECPQEPWQEITTAPKDGTFVDLWHSEFGRHADCYWGFPEHCCGEAGRYCDSEWHRLEAGWVDGTLNESLDASDFTHWHARPAPPAGHDRRQS